MSRYLFYLYSDYSSGPDRYVLMYLLSYIPSGAELSTDHYLVVSWVRWKGKHLDRPGKPKRVVRVNWERLDGAPV